MILRGILFGAVTLLCSAQETDWKKVDVLKGVDF